MRQIAFSGMWCSPTEIQKDGDFKIRGTMSTSRMTDHPPIIRYEHFASPAERDVRYNHIMKHLEDSFWT